MDTYFHSVRLDKDKCRGCTNCIKRCPTGAIRIRSGKAKVLKELCIDCGECIRVCPYHAKIAITNSLDNLKKFKYNRMLDYSPSIRLRSSDISLSNQLFIMFSQSVSFLKYWNFGSWYISRVCF